MLLANIAMLMDVAALSQGGRNANWKTSRWKLRSCLSCQIVLDTRWDLGRIRMLLMQNDRDIKTSIARAIKMEKDLTLAARLVRLQSHQIMFQKKHKRNIIENITTANRVVRKQQNSNLQLQLIKKEEVKFPKVPMSIKGMIKMTLLKMIKDVVWEPLCQVGSETTTLETILIFKMRCRKL